jgi:hypothetical protein
VHPDIDVRRADQRFRTTTDWLDSRHSFSFGQHYDPDNTHFGLLVACNDDVVAPGAGFERHQHADTEIVTWVLHGSLVHQDSTGHSGVVYPGLAQRMSAGSGVWHSETNDAWRLTGEPAHRLPVHFVQMWVPSDAASLPPAYEQLDVTAELQRGELVTVASGRRRHRDAAAIRINQRDAALHAAQLPAGQSVELPEAPYVHLFVARGAVDLAGAGRLARGDAVRLTGADGLRVAAVEPAELLVWEMHSGYLRAKRMSVTE